MSQILDHVAPEAEVGRYFEPHLRQTLAEARAVRVIEVNTTGLRVVLELGFPVGGFHEELLTALRHHLEEAGLAPSSLDLQLQSNITSHAVQRGLTPLKGIKNVVAVASGKGGVGKSTVAVNLALAWAAQGARVGLLDADIYGPSQPIMLGLQGERPSSRDGKHLVPLSAHGIVTMSIGFLVDVE
ncbi:MAG: Mrp/NBP35 family ATP-binding protein, partial [Gammaproteobacteria bacterium]|nr:Mrp/NBP35 family ATP-binding protein [Gammaproteobacteria bacterium]